ncbi:MAG: hypothetical protein ABSD68_04045 [Candidatus Micrarchaeales archaeon]
MFDAKVNRLLVIRLRDRIVMPLNDLIEWDRYGIRNDDDSGFIFGWIKRDDNYYDFVCFNFALVNNEFVFNYNSSSEKYSKEIAEKLSKKTGCSFRNAYLECKSASDIPEAKLIRWQKNISQESQAGSCLY